MSATFSLVSSETRDLTFEEAQRHRDMKGSPTERVIEPKRILYLKERLRDNLFVCPTWSIVKYKENGTEQILRMNGQHSSLAICQYVEALGQYEGDPENKPASLPKLSVHYDTYEASSRDSMAVLFRQFDARFSSRSAQDVSGAYQGLRNEIGDLDRSLALLAVKGISFFRRYVMGAADVPKGDDVGQLFFSDENFPFVKWVCDLVTIKTPELKRDCVVAAMYGTFEHKESIAPEFWDDVAKGGSNGSSAYVLSDLLVKEKDPNRKKMKPIQVCGTCLRSWNAWRQDKDPKGIRQPEGKPLPDIV